MWPRILQMQPKASLYIYSDVNGKWVNEVSGEQMKMVRQLLSQLGQQANIYYMGWVNKRVLAESWKSADIWFYPCIFVETFCMTALEAAKSRTLAVSNHTGSLRDTIGKRGITVDGNPMDPVWQEAALRALAPFLTYNPPPIKKELLLQNGAWADGLTWANQARILSSHARKHIYETRGMEGWINPIPTQGEKDAFIQVLQYFTQTRTQQGPITVLEVGSYSGMSLINIMARIPANARGYAVDTWTDYTEGGHTVRAGRKNIRRVFDKNMARAGIQDRVTAVQGDSHRVLTELVGRARPTRFDFIYVDGSHRCLDCYGDILLAWTLLNSGGILAIDDVSFDQKNEDRLAVPIEGVQLFCNRFFGHYTVLYNGYRLFLEKTPSTSTVPRFAGPGPGSAQKPKPNFI
jgi:predicted O-methyltransferase YrrM